jgi:hypothetical protein
MVGNPAGPHRVFLCVSRLVFRVRKGRATRDIHNVRYDTQCTRSFSVWLLLCVNLVFVSSIYLGCQQTIKSK